MFSSYSAAHCAKKIPKNWELVGVRIGEWNISSEIDCSKKDSKYCAPPVVDVHVIQTIVHPSYKKQSISQHFDIALLQLATKIEFNDFVQPACLPLDPSYFSKDYTSQSFEAVGLLYKSLKY